MGSYSMCPVSMIEVAGGRLDLLKTSVLKHTSIKSYIIMF